MWREPLWLPVTTFQFSKKSRAVTGASCLWVVMRTLKEVVDQMQLLPLCIPVPK